MSSFQRTFTLIFFFGGDLFAFVFGEEWYQSGKLSEIMAPWLMLNFVLSPLSTIPLVLNKQGTFFLLGLSASLLQLAGFLFLPCAVHQCRKGGPALRGTFECPLVYGA